MIVSSLTRTEGKNTCPARHSSTRRGLEAELADVPRERAFDVGDVEHEVIEGADPHHGHACYAAPLPVAASGVPEIHGCESRKRLTT